jgi:hypothetical protein
MATEAWQEDARVAAARWLVGTRVRASRGASCGGEWRSHSQASISYLMDDP